MKKSTVLMLLLILLVGCNQPNKDLRKSINSIVKDTRNSEISINSLTDFDWDKAFLFTPYSTNEAIQEQLGTKFKDKSNLDMRDDIYLLVFLNNDEVIHYIEIKRHGSDVSIGKKEYLTPKEDVMRIVRY